MIPEYGYSQSDSHRQLLKLDALKVNRSQPLSAGARPQWRSLFFPLRRDNEGQATNVAEFSNIRQNGLKALNLRDEDELINVFLTDGNADVIVGTAALFCPL